MIFETFSALELPNLLKHTSRSIVGLEIGVWRGDNAGYLLQNCNNISKLYGIDPYLPYQDWNRFITKEDIDPIKNAAVENLKMFGDRFELIETTATAAVNRFKDNSLDFIFIDGNHSFETCHQDLCNYYDKVKPGGIFAGHDYTLQGVNNALFKFRKEKKITGNFKVIPIDVWYWIKD